MVLCSNFSQRLGLGSDLARPKVANLGHDNNRIDKLRLNRASSQSHPVQSGFFMRRRKEFWPLQKTIAQNKTPIQRTNFGIQAMSVYCSHAIRFATATLTLFFLSTPTEAYQSETDVDAAEVVEANEESTINANEAEASSPEIDPQFLRIELWDGTVVSGIVGVEAIDVQTEFGSLRIPISRLVDFRPGLISLPELRAEVDSLVQQLGDREFKTRETAHRKLVAMGPMLAGMLSSLDDGGDAERKKHLVKIKEEVAAMLDDAEDEGMSTQATIAQGDQIQTPDFSIVGKIVQEQFQVKSKIGDLRILLADIKRADRGAAMKSAVLRKTVSVPGTTFFQKKALSTKIRVNRGDKISITASGIVQWTNWSQTASPDGLPNQGNWNGISNGALAGRIGSSGEVFSIGSDNTFTAKQAGILYLGIAMPDNYVKNTGYRWTGKFKAKIKVQPAQ